MKEAKQAVNTVGGLAAGEARRNEIPAAFSCLEERIDLLNEAVTTLAGCIQPVMRDSDPKTDEAATCGASTEVGEQLRMLETRISEITDTVNDMVERIEL